MASEDPNLAGFSSRSRPAPPTLDLKAEEVRDAAGSGTGSPAATLPPTGEGERSGSPAAASAASTPASDVKDEPSVQEGSAAKDAEVPKDTVAADAPASHEAKPDAAEPAEAESPSGPMPAAEAPPPAPAKASSGLGTLIAALLAGVVGGGLAAGGVVHFAPALGLMPPPPPAKVAPGPTLSDMKAMEQRISALEARPAASPAPVDSKAVAVMGERLDGVEKSIIALQSDFATLKRAREAATKAAEQAAAQPAPAIAGAPSAGLAASVADLKSAGDATQSALDAAKSEIVALKTAQDGLKTGMGALKTAQDGLQADLGALKTSQDSLQTQVGALKSGQDGLQTAVKATGEQTAALAPRLDEFGTQLKAAVTATKGLSASAASMVVLGALKEAMLSGRPFASELAAARSVLGPAAGPLDAYAGAADKGFGSLGALADKMAAEGAAAFVAIAPTPEGPASQPDIFTRLMSSAESLVKVRPAGEVAPTDPRAPLHAAVAALRAGSVDAALAAVKKLPQPVQDKLKDVTDTLMARQAAATTTATLYQQSLAAISGKMP